MVLTSLVVFLFEFEIKYGHIYRCNTVSQLGNDKYQLGNDEYRLGNDEYRLGNDKYQLGNDEYQLGNGKYRLGNDEYQLVFANVTPVVHKYKQAFGHNCLSTEKEILD